MIQRIQSLYLLIVTVLLVVTACIPAGSFACGEQLFELRSWGVLLPEGYDASSWGMLAILALAAFVSFATIFLFKNRVLQIRMTVFNCLLLVGYYLSLVAFVLILQKRMDADYHLSWGVCLPLVAIILNYLAIRAIGKDEFLVRAADRLR